MHYPGHDELAGLRVLGIDAVPQEGHEGHQVKGRTLRHNVLQIQRSPLIEDVNMYSDT